MCRRYSFFSSPETAGQPFDARPVPFFNFHPQYNAAPGAWMPVLTNEFPGVVQFFRWGLTPQWAKDDKMGLGMFNTFRDKITEKPAFEKIYKYKRCIVPANGWFYLPTAKAGKNAPALYVYLPGKRTLYFAGLWDVWGDGLYSFSIVTVPAAAQQAKLFPETPLVLNREQSLLWLQKGTAGHQQQALLQTPPTPVFDYHAINPALIAQGVNDESVTLPFTPPGNQPELF